MMVPSTSPPMLPVESSESPAWRPIGWTQSPGHQTLDGMWRVDYFPVPPRGIRTSQRVQVLLASTGWSLRTLADVLGTSHTTVGAIRDGRPLITTRSGDLDKRIVATAEVRDAAERRLRSVSRRGRLARWLGEDA